MEAKIDLNEKFYIFDNFLTSNKHILERGDEEWDSSKIFFQLSIEHADNSPLTHGAERFEDEGKVDWETILKINRDNKYKFNPLLKKVIIGDETIDKIYVLYNQNILVVTNQNIIILDNITYEENYRFKFKSQVTELIKIEEKIFSLC